MIDEIEQKVLAGAGGGGGDKGGGGSGSGSGHVATEDPDSLQSRSMLSVLDLIGEGQIGGLVDGAKSIYFNDTQLMASDGTYNFSGVTWDSRNGTQSQSVISGFAAVESPHDVGLRVKTTTPITFTVTNSAVDRVRCIVSFPSFLRQDPSNGDVHGTTVDYQFLVSINNGPMQDLSGVLTLTGKSRSKYQRNHVFALPKPTGATTWTIKMVRLTADATDGTTMNETWLAGYVEIVDARLNYPNSALVGITIDSSQFNQIPSRAYLVDGLYIKVPTNYTPATHTYSGVWNGTFKLAVSDDPAWILYDLLTTKRYGLGQFISESQVDKAKLYQISKYCNELVPDGYGGYEPRFTCNTTFQSRAEAYKMISDLTSVFRGMGFWDGSMVGFTQDAPTDPTMIYGPANVINGEFTYTGSSRKDRHSVALVTWNDPNQNYKQTIEYVEDQDLIARWGVRETSIVALGCTSRGQAHRAGLWLLYSESTETNAITFKVGLDTAMALPGQIVKINDPHRAGKRMAGRVVAVTAKTLTVDAPVTLSSSGAVLTLRLPDGTLVDRTLNNLAGTYSTLSWDTSLTTLPSTGTMWIVSDPNLVPLLARVVSISQGESIGQFVVSAVEHNPSKYDAIEKGLTLVEQKTSILSFNNVDTPTGLQVVEVPIVVAPGVIGTSVDVSWQSNAMYFEFSWKRDGTYQTNWTTTTTSSPNAEISNARAGHHYIRVTAVDAFGHRSETLTSDFDITGHTTAPGDVPNFKVARRTTDLLLTWDAASDIVGVRYEVRVGSSWDTAEVITTNFSGTMITHDQSEAGTYYYHVRSINAQGIYSDNTSTVQLDLLPPSAVTGFYGVQNGSRIEFQWDSSTEPNVVSYEIREGQAWNSGTLVTGVRATTYSMPTFYSEGVRTFWVKAIASPGIYGDTATFCYVDTVPQQNRNVVYTDDEAGYGWLGSKFNMSVQSGALVLNAGENYGEYTWGISLPAKFRARNSVQSSFDAIIADATAWSSATYRWVDNQAKRSWTITGDLTSVDLKLFISTYQGLDANTVEAFGLNAQTAGESGTHPATQAVGVTYDAGRFLKGAYLNDFSRLNWTINIPSVFSTTFWVIPKSLAGNKVYWAAVTASGLELMVGHDASTGLFYLEDTLGQKITVNQSVSLDDRVLIGVSQTATSRSLMVGNLGVGTNSATSSYAPLGAFTSLRLHQ